jgi:hypothetical protein
MDCLKVQISSRKDLIHASSVNVDLIAATLVSLSLMRVYLPIVFLTDAIVSQVRFINVHFCLPRSLCVLWRSQSTIKAVLQIVRLRRVG